VLPISARRLIQVCFLTAVILLTHRPLGASGDDGWHDHFDRAGGFDSALVVTKANGLIIVAGDTTNASGDRDWTVRAYEPRTGELVWQDHFDRAGGFDRALAATVVGNLLIVTGRTTNISGDMDWTVRAYEVRTGTLRWQSHFDRAGGFDRANSAAVARDSLVVAGDSTTAAGDFDWSVRGYHPRSGALLWENHFDRAGGNDRAYAVVEAKGIAVAAGHTTNASGNTDWTLRAHNPRTGALLWEDHFDRAGGGDGVWAATATRGLVVAAGHTVSSAGDSDWSVRAHDARTGAVRWEDHFDRAGGDDRAQAIAASGNLVVVGGWTTSAPSSATAKRDWSIRAYEAGSGFLLWEDHLDRAGGHDTDFGIAAGEGLVVAVGRTMDASGNYDWTVRAYEPRTGILLWEDHFDRAGGLEEAVAVSIAGNHVIVAGQSANAAGNQDWTVIAYDLERGNDD
jgi:hypothetical protein